MTTGAELAGVKSTDLNPTRTKSTPTPGTGTPGAPGESDPPVMADPSHEPNADTTPPPHLATEPADDPDEGEASPAEHARAVGTNLAQPARRRHPLRRRRPRSRSTR